MPEVLESIEIQAPADDVWELVGDPARIREWVPALSTSIFEAGQRVCTTENGAEIVERILERSDDQRYYVYEIASSPLPLSWYRSQLQVTGHDGRSHVLWEAQFEGKSADLEPELADAFARIYREGLATLRERFEAAAAA